MTDKCETFRDCTTIPLSFPKVLDLYTMPCGFQMSKTGHVNYARYPKFSHIYVHNAQTTCFSTNIVSALYTSFLLPVVTGVAYTLYVQLILMPNYNW